MKHLAYAMLSSLAHYASAVGHQIRGSVGYRYGCGCPSCVAHSRSELIRARLNGAKRSEAEAALEAERGYHQNTRVELAKLEARIHGYSVGA